MRGIHKNEKLFTPYLCLVTALAVEAMAYIAMEDRGCHKSVQPGWVGQARLQLYCTAHALHGDWVTYETTHDHAVELVWCVLKHVVYIQMQSLAISMYKSLQTCVKN